MEALELKEKFGYSVEKFLEFFKKNKKLPKGSFQIKKRNDSYYWYYALSKASSDRVKYLCKADSSNSFDVALNALNKKYLKFEKKALEANIPAGPLASKWKKYRSSIPLVSPANKKKMDIIVIGTGLAGASASASLGELGYNVKSFCFQDSPRRAHGARTGADVPVRERRKMGAGRPTSGQRRQA